MLEIRHFSKDFNGLPVLSNFSLALPRNSFTVLVGPSGCGKSTLFDLLMGSVSRDGGRLFLFGAELPDLRGEAGYMAQKDLLLPWLSLIQNALLPVMVKRKLTSDDFTEAKSLFSSLEL
jgi:NitT/TauT family transport system ATP-binding protein